MVTASEYVSRETLEQVSTESFAQNLSNFRSLLLSWEKAVDSGAAFDLRAQTMLREAAMLQEIIQGQMTAKGRDLGVPPEAVHEVLAIYRRAFLKILLRTATDSKLMSQEIDHFIQVIDGVLGAPPEMKAIASKLSLARTAYETMKKSPEAASMVAPGFITLLNEIVAAYRGAGGKVPDTTTPPSPPIPPTQGGAGGDPGGDLPRRVGALESKMDKVTDDISNIKATLMRVEEMLKHSAMKSDITRLEERSTHAATRRDLENIVAPLRENDSKLSERLGHMPTKAEMYLAGGGAIAGLFAIVAKGFKWW